MTTTDREKAFLQSISAPPVRDGGQRLRNLFSKIGGQAAPEVDEHQGDGSWNSVIAAVLGAKPADSDDPADDDTPA